MMYIDIAPPVYYQYQPEIVIEQPIYYEPVPIYIQPPYIPSYPTVEYQQRIQTPSGTIILDRSRERFYVEPY